MLTKYRFLDMDHTIRKQIALSGCQLLMSSRHHIGNGFYRIVYHVMGFILIDCPFFGSCIH